MSKRTVGLILIILGALSCVGAVGGGKFEHFGEKNMISDVTMACVMAALFVVGIVLVIIGGKKKH